MKPILMPMALMLTAGLALTACNKSPEDKQADAVRTSTEAVADSVDAQADAVAADGKAAAEATKDNATSTADAMHDQADAIKDKGEAKADAIEDGKTVATSSTTKTDAMGNAVTTEKTTTKTK